MRKKAAKVTSPKRGHRRATRPATRSAVRPAVRRVAGGRPQGDKLKPVPAPGHHTAREKTKGQSALGTAVAEDELEERRRLFAKARKGDKGAVAKIYELYGARIYTTAQVKEVKPTGFPTQVVPFRKRAQRS
jgi:hypothetical protein